MGDILFSVDSRYKRDIIHLFVDNELKVGIKNSAGMFISSAISPFQLAAYIYSSLAEQIDKKSIFFDSGADFYYKGEWKGKGVVKIYKGRISPVKEKFPLKLTSAKIEGNFFSENEEFNLIFKLTAVKSLEFIGLLLARTKPLPHYFLSEIKLIRKDSGISFKIGAGKPLILPPDDINVLLFALERWISGYCIADEYEIEKFNFLPDIEKESRERPYRTTRVNRNGFLFSAKINFKEFMEHNNSILKTNININGFMTQLTFMEIVELYFVLKNMYSSFVE